MGPNNVRHSGSESDTHSHSESVGLEAGPQPGARMNADRGHEHSTTYDWQETERTRRVEATKIHDRTGLRVIKFEPWNADSRRDPAWGKFFYHSRLVLAVPLESRRHKHRSLVQGVYRVALCPKLLHQYIVILKVSLFPSGGDISRV